MYIVWLVTALKMKVDLFLSELERRLDFLETYGNLSIDITFSRAYATLQAVRKACSHASDEVIGAGRRRANLLVETLEKSYKDIMPTRESLDQRIQTGLRILEDMLADFETRAYAVRGASLDSVTSGIVGEGHRLMDEGIGIAKDVVDEGIEVARRAKESLKQSIERAILLAKSHGLITYEELPIPWRCNPHITSGYRFNETKLACIRSVLSISNEFFNIWSHAIGFLIVLSLAFYFYPTSENFTVSTKSDIFVAACFFFAACKCLVCSFLWHTMSSISHQGIMERFACVDYTGISLLIAASILTSEYTAFYCDPVSRWAYMVWTSFFGLSGVIIPWHPFFNRPDMKWLRVAFYVTLGATGLTPAIQLSYYRGTDWTYHFYEPIFKSLFVYLVGAVVYASHIPECWFPGCFDYLGGSHNLWHVAVLAGILFHYSAMQEFFRAAFALSESGCSAY
jgi:adiponectin receptor